MYLLTGELDEASVATAGAAEISFIGVSCAHVSHIPRQASWGMLSGQSQINKRKQKDFVKSLCQVSYCPIGQRSSHGLVQSHSGQSLQSYRIKYMDVERPFTGADC